MWMNRWRNVSIHKFLCLKQEGKGISYILYLISLKLIKDNLATTMGESFVTSMKDEVFLSRQVRVGRTVGIFSTLWNCQSHRTISKNCNSQSNSCLFIVWIPCNPSHGRKLYCIFLCKYGFLHSICLVILSLQLNYSMGCEEKNTFPLINLLKDGSAGPL